MDFAADVSTTPDDDELTSALMGGLGDLEPDFSDPAMTGGYGGYPGTSSRQTTPEYVYADYMRKLRELGYAAPDSGNAYDPAVRAAVAQFQSDYGLEVDGLGGSGSNTFRVIDQVYAANQGPGVPGPGDAPPFKPGDVDPPGDLPAQPVADVVGHGTNWLLVGGAAAVVGGAIWYFWGR